MIELKDWFLSISKSYLAILQVIAEDYIDNIGQPGSHIDLLGLFVLSRLYKFHFRLFYDQGVWCTARNKDYKQTSMMLIFRGETSFGEMCVLGNTQEYLDSLIRNTQWNLMPSHNNEAKGLRCRNIRKFVFRTDCKYHGRKGPQGTKTSSEA